jgi:hypothetical protein
MLFRCLSPGTEPRAGRFPGTGRSDRHDRGDTRARRLRAPSDPRRQRRPAAKHRGVGPLRDVRRTTFADGAPLMAHGGLRFEAGQEIVLLPIFRFPGESRGLPVPPREPGAHWQDVAILRRSEAADPWIPAFAGKARVPVDDFLSRSAYLPSLSAYPPHKHRRAGEQERIPPAKGDDNSPFSHAA